MIQENNSPRYNSRSASSVVATEEKPISTSRSNKNLRGANGLRSNPTQESDVMEFASPHRKTPSGGRSSIQTASPPPLKSVKTPPARDPQQNDGSTRDFADFIRSTGPNSEPRPLAKQSAERPEVERVTSGGSQANSRPPSRKITKQQPAVSSKKSEPNLPPRGGSKLKARDPIASPTNTTAELADFFRSGPPGAQINNRSVSSPQPNGKVSSAASTQDSFAASKMTQSSTNSRTGLLDPSNRGKAGTQRPQDMAGPVRKQRRVKDPYAIDSDEEDEVTEEEPAEEESLADFLRNYPPPDEKPENSVRRSATSPSPPSQPQDSRKASGVSMRERIARNIAVIPDYRPLPPKENKKPSTQSTTTSRGPPSSSSTPDKRSAATSPTNRSKSQPQLPPSSTSSPQTQTQQQQQQQPAAPQLPPLKSMSSSSNSPTRSTAASSGNARPTSPHLTQNGTRLDTLRPSQPTYAKHMDPRSGGTRPKMQARVEDGRKGGAGSMADLADFLRETEPPAPSGPVAGGAGGGPGGPVPGGKAAKMMGAGSGAGMGANGVGSGVGVGEKRARGGGGEERERDRERESKGSSGGGGWRMWGKRK